jgi:hypothetical protein
MSSLETQEVQRTAIRPCHQHAFSRIPNHLDAAEQDKAAQRNGSGQGQPPYKPTPYHQTPTRDMPPLHCIASQQLICWDCGVTVLCFHCFADDTLRPAPGREKIISCCALI